MCKHTNGTPGHTYRFPMDDLRLIQDLCRTPDNRWWRRQEDPKGMSSDGNTLQSVGEGNWRAIDSSFPCISVRRVRFNIMQMTSLPNLSKSTMSFSRPRRSPRIVHDAPVARYHGDRLQRRYDAPYMEQKQIARSAHATCSASDLIPPLQRADANPLLSTLC
jgi:hypothetical protein